MSDPVFPDLHGQSVFITGGGSGIGAALTEAFLRQGAKVAFVQRSDASTFVEEMASLTGNRPLFLPCDITDIPRFRPRSPRRPRRMAPSRCWSTTPPTTSATRPRR
jgi:NAD(P)-dependent dehydrogenase (short-subunit alcohol dehydrogenase family)